MKRPSKRDHTQMIAGFLGVRVVGSIRPPKPVLPDMFEPTAATIQAPPLTNCATKKTIREIERAMIENVQHVLERGQTTGDRAWSGRGAPPVEDASLGAHPASILSHEAVELLLGARLIEPTSGFNRFAWTAEGQTAKTQVRAR